MWMTESYDCGRLSCDILEIRVATTARWSDFTDFTDLL